MVLAEKAGLCIDTVQIACKGCRVSLESADKMAKVLQCAVDKAFKLEVRKSPYSSTTINSVHRFLRAVCHYAEKHKLLTDNPIDAVRAPKIDAEIYVFSEEESARFIRAVMREKDIRVKTALLILIYLGLRKGELCGLTWGSVDLGKGIVHVAQQLKEKSGEGLILGKLKTKESKADLPLSPMLAEVLAEYRQWWNEHKAMYGDAWRGEWECLFVGDDGTPLNPSTINEWLDKLTERNGLPHVTVHSLRHLCATLLIRTHADPKTVQTILRHANVSTTLNIYAKVFDSTQMEAIGRVQASLENMLKESCSSSAQV
jgi:integrase